LKPCSLFFFDEPSNHLDSECVEALSDALSGWGEDHGAVVIISHDRNFCDQVSVHKVCLCPFNQATASVLTSLFVSPRFPKIDFTHVATVDQGKFSMEERGVRESDWEIESLGAAASKQNALEPTTSSPRQSDLDPSTRKKLFNAPKRLLKLEQLVESSEQQIAAIDADMQLLWNDTAQLAELTNKRSKLERTTARYMKEWEELELLLAQYA
jgi:ABC-type multidrug transport system ATPase subunit